MASASTMDQKTLQRTDYHVAWICPVATIELLPSRVMLDEEHDTPPYDPDYDDNIYIFGTIAGHNLAMATCPKGMTGNANAGRLAGPLFTTFPNIRMALLVGIGFVAHRIRRERKNVSFLKAYTCSQSGIENWWLSSLLTSL
ncbi:hypothetical protein NUW58_g938 [Xylaria curta]|uniref:Uncharacterized protein n=1 Tax=Xylaria curta TaxID=42375 RepID=A0ACC1PNS6_9PEZI|nr:hypothetical protein NUW58_g938 [Xylaria curta]